MSTAIALTARKSTSLPAAHANRIRLESSHLICTAYPGGRGNRLWERTRMSTPVSCPRCVSLTVVDIQAFPGPLCWTVSAWTVYAPSGETASACHTTA